jgi:hypothetical protein
MERRAALVVERRRLLSAGQAGELWHIGIGLVPEAGRVLELLPLGGGVALMLCYQA